MTDKVVIHAPSARPSTADLREWSRAARAAATLGLSDNASVLSAAADFVDLIANDEPTVIVDRFETREAFPDDSYHITATLHADGVLLRVEKFWRGEFYEAVEQLLTNHAAVEDSQPFSVRFAEEVQAILS